MYNLSTILTAFATLIGVVGGFPTPPKLFIKLTKFKLVQWLLVFFLVYQGGGDQEIVFSLIMTFTLFIIYKIFYYFENKENKEN